MSISFGIPAYLSDFSTLEDQRTICKLKMFYVGETEDGRVFNKDFSEELVKSLPYTPVVAFYSDLKDDFVGHNSTQYMYGVVTSDAKSGFETDENGVEWFITEVLLYTDRIDNIGEVAKKIVGHAQSLEMDPNTVEYEVFKENGKTKIAFKKARLAGLSVLGTGQKPAFTGSEFFIDRKDLRERFENFFSCLEQKDRGASMENKEKFVELLNFIRLSYDEKRRMVCEYAQTQFGDDYAVFVREMFDDTCTLEILSFADWSSEYKMYDYSIDEVEGVKLENERKCFLRFVTTEDLAKIEAAFSSQASTETPNEDLESTNKDTQPSQEGEQTDGNENNKDKEENFSSNPAPLSDSEREELEAFRAKEAEVKAQIEQLKTEIANYKAQNEAITAENTALKGDHEELEGFRLERKLNLVNSYKDELTAETIQSFTNNASKASYEELEAQLAIEFRKVSKNNTKNNTMAFSFNSMFNNATDTNTNQPNDYASLVKRYSKNNGV